MFPESKIVNPQVLKHDNRTCQRCGCTDRIQIHHIDGDQSHNTLDNLVVLCKICHNQIHVKWNKEPKFWRPVSPYWNPEIKDQV